MKFLAIAALSVAAAAPVSAAVVTYSGNDNGTYLGASPNADAAAAQFAAALSSSTLYTFESATVGAANFTAGDLTFAATNLVPGTAGVSDQSNITLGFNTTDGGSKFYEFMVASTAQPALLTITLASPATAFGFFYSATSTASGVLDLLFDDGSSQSLSVNLGPAVGGNVGFLGFTTTGSLSAVTLRQSGYVEGGGIDRFGIDDIRYGIAQVEDVPEPAMLGLFGLGALGLAFARRRRG